MISAWPIPRDYNSSKLIIFSVFATSVDYYTVVAVFFVVLVFVLVSTDFGNSSSSGIYSSSVILSSLDYYVAE